MYKEVCLERIPLYSSVHSFPFGALLTVPFTLFMATPRSSYSKLIHYLPADLKILQHIAIEVKSWQVILQKSFSFSKRNGIRFPSSSLSSQAVPIPLYTPLAAFTVWITLPEYVLCLPFNASLSLQLLLSHSRNFINVP